MKIKYFLLISLIFIVLTMRFIVAEEYDYEGSLQVSSGQGKIIITGPGGVPQHYCGNGIYELAYSEQCDGSDMPFTQCKDYLGNNYTGTLSCTSQCILNTNQCSLIQQSAPTTGGSSSSGGSGGSSGGSSTKSTSSSNSSSSSTASASCIENWECTNWSNEGLCGTRTCVDNNKCKTEELKPSEKLECSSIGVKEGILSRITGAVIGGGSPAKLGALVFIILVVVALIFINLYRKKEQKKE